MKPSSSEESAGSRIDESDVNVKKETEDSRTEVEWDEAEVAVENRRKRLDSSPVNWSSWEDDLVGLALSGGGIRSATFSLGVLQRLARIGLLDRVDYISTVSGGGYIGGWFQAFCHHKSFSSVSGALKKRVRTNQNSNNGDEFEAGQTLEAPEISFLRRFSNYIAPRVGLLSGDTWAIVGVYLRNLLLNLTILALSVALCFLLLHSIFGVVLNNFEIGTTWLSVVAALSGAVAVGFLIWASVRNPKKEDSESNEEDCGHGMFAWQVQLSIIIPLFVSACVTSWLTFVNRDVIWDERKMVLFVCCAAYFIFWAAVSIIYGLFKPVDAEDLTAWRYRGTWITLSSIPAGVVLGLMVLGLARMIGETSSAVVHAMEGLSFTVLSSPISSGSLVLTALPIAVSLLLAQAIGTPALIIGYTIVGTIHLGFAGRSIHSEIREWWGRLGGLLILYSLVWAVFAAIVFFGPGLLYWLGEEMRGLRVVLTSSWLISTLSGLLLARRAGDDKTPLWITAAVRIAPWVFLFGFVLSMSLVVQDVLLKVLPSSGSFLPLMFKTLDPFITTATIAALSTGKQVGMLLVIAAGLVFVLSLTVDVNEFSMHGFYRNRLVRTFLGASRQSKRHYDRFTGLDSNDDLELTDLLQGESDPGPYPIINSTMNLVHGKELAWQQRKGASFVLTPHQCGYDKIGLEGLSGFREPAFLATELFKVSGAPPTLGMAMAVSGAAVSPNMGLFSSPALMALLTIFNLRLGWWAPNPKHILKDIELGNTAKQEKGWKRIRIRIEQLRRKAPALAFWFLLCEAFGLTNARRRFVYLSDGGHFENLGLYELIKRKCRLIVVSDAGADSDLTFSDLGNAIARCRTDFGTQISIDTSPVTCIVNGHSSSHCLVGSIDYRDGRPEGTLVILKAALTGDEPKDVLSYASRSEDFPHETTADQFFDESQFESYRVLGLHIASEILPAVDEIPAPSDRVSIDDYIKTLKDQACIASSLSSESVVRYAEQLDRMYETLRKDPHLQFLDYQFYPEWRELMRGAQPSSASTMFPFSRFASVVTQGLQSGGTHAMSLPDSTDARRAGFYFCADLIVFMESVFLDLDLDRSGDHPDKVGWKNLFKHWCWSGMFRATWGIVASGSGKRFRRYCEDQLGLKSGENEISQLISLPPTDESDLKKHLNFIERDLYNHLMSSEDLSVQPNGLILFYLKIPLPEKCGKVRPRSDIESRSFKFGFALVRTEEEGVCNQLIYLRIQDHLRQQGLSDWALTQLVKKRYFILDPNAHRKIILRALKGSREEATDESLERFMRLYERVKDEFDDLERQNTAQESTPAPT